MNRIFVLYIAFFSVLLYHQNGDLYEFKKLLTTTRICTITAVLLVSCSCAGSVPNTDAAAETTLSAEANTKGGNNSSNNQSNTVPTQPQGGVNKDNVTVKFDDLI